MSDQSREKSNYFGGDGPGDMIRVTQRYEADEPVREFRMFLEEIYGEVINGVDLDPDRDKGLIYGADQDNNMYLKGGDLVMPNIGEEGFKVVAFQKASEYAREVNDELKYRVTLIPEAPWKDRREIKAFLNSFDRRYGDITRKFEEGEWERRKQELEEKRDARMMGEHMGLMGGVKEFEEISVSGYTKEDIALPEDIMKEAEYYFEGCLKNPELFDRGSSDGCTGMIIHGDPGVGKTLLAKVFASETNSSFFKANINDFRNPLVGTSSGAVGQIFDDAIEAASRGSPSVIYFEEADSIIKYRDDGSSGNVNEEVVDTILDRMDGLNELENVLVVGATNREEVLDSAATRPGRFNVKIEVPRPNRDNRERIFEIHTLESDSEVYDSAWLTDIPTLADMTEGFTGADISKVVAEAEKKKRQELADEYGEYAEIPVSEFRVGQSYLEEAVEKVREEELEPDGASDTGKVLRPES